jgi:hypothetical protein
MVEMLDAHAFGLLSLIPQSVTCRHSEHPDDY